MSAPVPACPKCGAEMTVRTARRGPNAGGQFYGCVSYPKCKGTLSLDGTQEKPKNTKNNRGDYVGFSPRVEYSDRVDRSGWRTVYTIGGGRLRSSTVIADVGDELGPSSIARIAQGFFAVSQGGETVNDSAVIQVVGTFRKLLQRGDFPPLDPDAELDFLKAVGVDDIYRSQDPGDLGFSLGRTCTPDRDSVQRALAASDSEFILRTDLKMDSDEEFTFLGLVRDQLGGQVARWFYPQVGFSAILSDPTDARRVDFLFSPPWGKPYVIEIDGLQHDQARLSDHSRDSALQECGIEVIRISAGLIRNGDIGIVTEKLQHDIPGEFNSPRRGNAFRLVHGPAYATRLGLAIAEAVQRGWLEGAGTWTIRIDDPVAVVESALPSLLEMFAAIDELWAGYLAPERCLVDLGGRQVGFQRQGTCKYVRLVPEQVDAARPTVSIVIQPTLSPMDELPSVTDPTIIVRAATLPFKLAERRAEGSKLVLARDPSALDAALTRILRYVFAKKEFRSGQLQSLRQTLLGKDCLVLLPTGAGKSLIYQLAGLLLPGRTLIIDPIIALMEDQIEGLKSAGIDRAVGLSSFTTQQGMASKALELVKTGDALFFFISPERLQTEQFRAALKTLTVTVPINLAVVDEAHCISEWGHDFRPSYLNLGPVIRRTCEAPDKSAPPILALTGTASRAVLRDILIELDLDRTDPEGVIKPVSFDREELSFDVIRTSPGEATFRMTGLLRGLSNKLDLPDLYREQGRNANLGVVFCPHVNGKLGVVDIANAVAQNVTPHVGFYSGTAPNGFDRKGWDYDKRTTAERFRKGDLLVLCATKAFGMGVDIPNVRFTLHFGIPGSIESFYQEAGRAGRDRRRSICAIVFSEIDERLSERLLAESVEGDNARQQFEARGKADRDDILNQLWFHFNTFRGKQIENTNIESLINELEWNGMARTVTVPFGSDKDGASKERAILRLCQVGMVSDYLKEWGSRHFTVTLEEADIDDLNRAFMAFVTRTQPSRFDERMLTLRALDDDHSLAQRALALAHFVQDMVYDTIEKSRRRALREMRLLAAESNGDRDIRQRIEDYFREGDLAPVMEQMLEAQSVVLVEWFSLLRPLSAMDEGELRGTSARFLESSPDHPGLLICRAYAELMGGKNVFEYQDNLSRAIASGRDRYAMNKEQLEMIIDFFLKFSDTFDSGWRAIPWLAWEATYGSEVECTLEDEVFRDTAKDPAELVVLMARRLDRIAGKSSQLLVSLLS